MSEVTHYRSSKGLMPIAEIPYPHLANAISTLERENDVERAPELVALRAELRRRPAPAALGADAPPNHNKPPPEAETPVSAASWPAIKAHLDDLLLEARNWADGSAIDTQAQADEVARLRDRLRDGAALADTARKAERAPYDVAIDEIQERYNAYIAPLKNRTPGRVSVALDALSVTQTGWLRAVEAKQRAEAERLRLEAAAKIAEAADALRASAGNIEAREEAEALFTDAKQIERAATQAEGAKAHAFGDGKATGLRDNWTATLANGTETLRWAWGKYRAELEAFALDLARKEVRAGVRTIPGFVISNERRV